jgi:hypothetical protein
MFGHGFDGDHEVRCAPRHDGGMRFVHRSITMNGSAQRNGPIDLLNGGNDGLKLMGLSRLGLWWGWGKTCEISVDL